MRFLFGIIFFGVGIIGLFRPMWITAMMGRNAWADRNLGAEGGTTALYRFLGFVLFILSLTFMLFRWPF